MELTQYIQSFPANMRFDLRKLAADMITSGVNQVLDLLENFWEITYSEQSWVDQGLEWKKP